MFALKFTFIFLAQLLAILNSYLYTVCPMAILKWSAFLREDLQPCKIMTDTLAPVERIGRCRPGILPLTGMMSVRPGCMVRTISGQLVTSCLHLGGFSTSLPTPPSPPTRPPPCNTELKLMHTFEKIV